MTSPADVTIDRLPAPTPAERDAIIALEGESFSNPWSAETFDRMLSIPVSQVYVARDRDGIIVGFCACWVIDDEVHINTVAVSERLRRRGIASKLIAEILQRTGAARATLEVRRSNTAAIRLYERLGFKVTAIREAYYEKPNEDGLILWLNP